MAEEGTQKTQTLECPPESDEIPTKEQTPSSESVPIENPCHDSPKSDKTLDGSSKTEETPETLKNVDDDENANANVKAKANVSLAESLLLKNSFQDDDEEVDVDLDKLMEGIIGDGDVEGDNSNPNGFSENPQMGFNFDDHDDNKGLVCSDNNVNGDGERNPSFFDPHPYYMRRNFRSCWWDPHCRCFKCMEKEPEFSPFPFRRWKEPEPCPVGAGLANMGNTCFLNAIMQCFIHTVPLAQGLLSFKNESFDHGNDEFCVLCAVRDQIECSLAYSGRVVSPANLVDNLGQISSFFRRYQQEDAHEFLQCLLDKLDSNWLKHEANGDDSSASDDSLVKQVFGGRLVSQLHCSNCGHKSDTYEPLIDLSLEIEDVDNLDSALRSFTKVEHLEDTGKFTCESCKEQVPIQKQLLLDKTPSVAALHLKRFKSDGLYVEKIDRRVEYPLELDLKPYTKGAEDEKEELKYELYAAVVHIGLSSTSGHYYCYVRSAPDTWYRFDDSRVTRVTEEYALSEDAYILFYAKKGTSWFSSFFEKMKACSEQKISSTSPKSVLDGMDLPSTSKFLGSSVHGSQAVGKGNTDEGAAAETSVRVRYDDVETIDGVESQGSAEASRYYSSSLIGPSHEVAKVDEAGFNGLSSVRATSSCTQSAARTSDETCSPSHAENIEVERKIRNDFHADPSTPPRCSSPGIYSDDETAEEKTYQIPIDHLKIEDKASSAKKSMDKAKHDLKRKEAAKYCRSMPTGRRQTLLAAMMGGSRSDNHLHKKRRRQGLFKHSWQSPKKRVKVSPKRVLRPLVA